MEIALLKTAKLLNWECEMWISFTVLAPWKAGQETFTDHNCHCNKSLNYIFSLLSKEEICHAMVGQKSLGQTLQKTLNESCTVTF